MPAKTTTDVDQRIREQIIGVCRARGDAPVTADQLRESVTGQNSRIDRVRRELLTEGVLKRAAYGGGVRLVRDPDE